MNDETIGNPQERLGLDWVGGIIDGEGCITITSYFKRYNGTNIFTATPIIQITNTNYKLISLVEMVYDREGIRHYICQTQPKAKNTKIRYDIKIQGLERCREACEILKPYIFVKDEQINLIEEFCNHRLSLVRNHPQTPESLQMITKIRELNSKGSKILNDYTPDSIKNAIIEMI